MNNIIRILLVLLVLVSLSNADKVPRFSDYLNSGSKGMAIIKEQSKHDGGKENIQNTLSEQIALAEVLLNQVVWGKLSELPKEPDYSDLESLLKKHGCFPVMNGNRKYFLERHMAWMEHFKETATRDTNRSEVALRWDMSRMENRLKAVELPFEQFKLYEKLASNARIHLNTGEQTLCFGEIVQLNSAGDEKNDAESHNGRYLLQLLAHTCLKIHESDIHSCFAGVIRLSLNAEENPVYYLHVWDTYGNPTGMWTLGNEEMQRRITAVDSVSCADGKLRVLFKDQDESYQQDFPLSALPRPTEKLDEENIGKRRLDEIYLTDDIVKDSLEFFRSIQYNFIQSEPNVAKIATEGLFDNRKCSIIYVDKYIASYRIEASSYGGGGIDTAVVVGTIARMGKQKELELSDIATKGQYQQMTELIRKELMKHFEAKTYKELWEGLSCDPLPTDNFYYDNKGLHFVYNQGKIAPMALGTIEVCIQWPLPKWVRGMPSP